LNDQNTGNKGGLVLNAAETNKEKPAKAGCC